MELPVLATNDYIDWLGMENKTVVDVGGSLGFVMGAVAEAYPEVNCVSFDLPEMTAEAQARPDHITFVEGDMFKDGCIPKGDVVFLKHVLRNWKDEDALRILQNCRAAIPDNGQVIVVDGLLPEPGQAGENDIPQFNSDVLMMTLGGRERTRREIEELARIAKMKVERLTQTPLPGCQIAVLTK